MKRLLIPLFMILSIVFVSAEVNLDILEDLGGPFDQDGFVIKTKGRLTIIEGTVIDRQTNEPVGKGVKVNVYCDHGQINLIKKTKTKDGGSYLTFTFNIASKKKCVAGDDAWVEVKYQDEWWESEHATVHSENFYDHANVDAFVGVPEFSTFTLGLAVIGGTLGLVFIRKQEG